MFCWYQCLAAYLCKVYRAMNARYGYVVLAASFLAIIALALLPFNNDPPWPTAAMHIMAIHSNTFL